MLVETLFCVDAILSKVIKSSKISRLQGLDVKKKMVHQILKLKVKNLIYLQVEIEHYLIIHIDVLRIHVPNWSKCFLQNCRFCENIDFSWVLFRLCEHKLSTDSFQNKINVLSCLKVKL